MLSDQHMTLIGGVQSTPSLGEVVLLMCTTTSEIRISPFFVVFHLPRNSIYLLALKVEALCVSDLSVHLFELSLQGM